MGGHQQDGHLGRKLQAGQAHQRRDRDVEGDARLLAGEPVGFGQRLALLQPGEVDDRYGEGDLWGNDLDRLAASPAETGAEGAMALQQQAPGSLQVRMGKPALQAPADGHVQRRIAGIELLQDPKPPLRQGAGELRRSRRHIGRHKSCVVLRCVESGQGRIRRS